MSGLQKLGLFNEVEINAAEFTPRDIYQLNIFDSHFDKPEICDEADAYLQYCQLLGDTRIYLDDYSTRPASDWMCESCPNPFATDKKIIGC